MEKKNYKVLRKAKRTKWRIAEDEAKYISDRKTEKWKACAAKKKITNAIFNKKQYLGYFCVYIIPNYMGTGDHYCGQTGNLYARMTAHRSVGRVNTENHRVLGCFRTREQALAFEAIQHEAGYHGYNNGI